MPMASKQTRRMSRPRSKDDCGLIALALRIEVDMLRASGALKRSDDPAANLLRAHADETARKHLPGSLRTRLMLDLEKTLAQKTRPVFDTLGLARRPSSA